MGTFNWPLFQLVVDFFIVILVCYLLYVLFREQKQRFQLKKWILRQMNLNREPHQATEQETDGPPESPEETIERLRREIDRARQVLDTLESTLGAELKPSTKSVTPQPAMMDSLSQSTSQAEAAQERPDTVREAIRYLLKKGMRPLEISMQLHIPIEDVERIYESELTSSQRKI